MTRANRAAFYGTVAAVMLMYFFTPTHGIISVSLAAMAESYPHLSASALTYVTTIVNITQVVASIGAGMLIGRRMSFKMAGITALALYTVAGGLPFFFGDNVPFSVLLLCRGLLGLGLGAFSPICNSSIAFLFDKENTRASMLGIGNVCFSLGATVGNLVAGFLCLISWQTTYAFYLFGIIPLLLFVIFYKEPDVHKEPVTEQQPEREKLRLPGVAWYYLFLLLIVMLLSQFNWNYIAFIATDLGYSSAVIGTIVTCFTVGAILGGFAYGIFYRLFKHYILFFAMALVIVSFAILYAATLEVFSSALIAFYLAFFISGFSSTQFTSGIPMSLSLTVPASAVAAAMGLFFAFQNIGSFLASPVGQVYFGVLGEGAPLNNIFILGIVVSVILTIVTFFTSLKNARLAKEQEHQAGV